MICLKAFIVRERKRRRRRLVLLFILKKFFVFVLKSSRVSVPTGHGLIVAKQKTKEEKKSKLDAQTQISDGALEIIISLRLTCAFIVK